MTSCKELFIDIETYSDVDLKQSGVYRYTESPNFEILLFAYSVDKSEVKVVDLAQGEKIPEDIINSLSNPGVIKHSYNAVFERTALSKHLGYYLEPYGWHCDLVHSATLGLPMSLENVGKVLELDKKKLETGKKLIQLFCTPKKGVRTYPKDEPVKWEEFKTYNKRDVETEIEIHNRIAKFPVPEKEWENYWLDQKINDYGVMLDMDFVKHAIKCDEISSKSAYDKVATITGVDNPNSPKQLKEWLVEQGIAGVESLSKKDVARMLESAKGSVEEILKLRQELAKSSVKKYFTMENVVCKDSRARGLIQFYGARTGRFAGRLIQVQNLVSNHLTDLARARELVRNENLKEIIAKYGSVSQVLSELVRTAFIPKEGCRFIVCDYSAIEARILAWYAKEHWRLELFRDNGDIYSMSASKMFGIPVVKNGINGEYRKVGKVSELACGFGGSVGALKAFGALELGLKEENLQGIIDKWRNNNPHIVKFWWDVDKACKYVIENKSQCSCYGLTFSYERGIMFIKLPSGRRLAYCKPRIGINAFGTKSIMYEGMTQNKKWSAIETFSGKLVENIVQATARDILCEAMQRLDKLGYKIVMHVHDEVVLEVPDKESSIQEIGKIMSEAPSWYDGILKADGYECSFYKKE